METIIVPILAFLFFACIVFSLATAISAFRRLPADSMSTEERRARLRPAMNKAGILLLVAIAAIALLAIVTFSTP